MTSESTGQVIDLHNLRRSCGECSLRSLCLPAGIGQEGIEQLDDIVQARVPLARGDVLFRDEDPFEHLYVVRSGSLRNTLPWPDGEDQVVGFHLPGELVGIEAISDRRHHCQATALERTSICAVPFTHLENVAARLPALQRQLHRLISHELAEDHKHLIAMGRRTARQRVALFLCNLSRRLENAGHDGTAFRLSMSREDIANYLGLAVETVSRLLTTLAEEKLLEVERRQLRILDVSGLEHMAGHVPPVAGSGARDAGDLA